VDSAVNRKLRCNVARKERSPRLRVGPHENRRPVLGCICELHAHSVRARTRMAVQEYRYAVPAHRVRKSSRSCTEGSGEDKKEDTSLFWPHSRSRPRHDGVSSRDNSAGIIHHAQRHATCTYARARYVEIVGDLRWTSKRRCSFGFIERKEQSLFRLLFPFFLFFS